MRKTFHSVTPNSVPSLAMSAFVMSQISRVRYRKYGECFGLWDVSQ